MSASRAKTDRVVIGVDPGSRSTGAVVRWGGQLLDHRVIESGDLTGALSDLKAFVAMSQQHHGFHSFIVAVEGVQAPNVWHDGKKQMLHPGSLIGTAAMFGGVVATWPNAIVVPPGGHGSGPRFAYPRELWGAREGAAGTGKLRHCRSAWDVALAAVRLPLLADGAVPAGEATG